MVFSTVQFHHLFHEDYGLHHRDNFGYCCQYDGIKYGLVTSSSLFICFRKTLGFIIGITLAVAAVLFMCSMFGRKLCRRGQTSRQGSESSGSDPGVVTSSDTGTTHKDTTKQPKGHIVDYQIANCIPFVYKVFSIERLVVVCTCSTFSSREYFTQVVGETCFT